MSAATKRAPLYGDGRDEPPAEVYDADFAHNQSASAREAKPEAPRPLVREMPPANPFPIEALGQALGGAAKAIRDRVQAPLAICGQSVLAAATLAAQAHANVKLPTEQARPLSEFFVTIAESGERKTSCDDEALRPIHSREEVLREQRETNLPHHLNEKAAWEAARAAAIKGAKGDRAAIKAALDALGPEPTPPLAALLTCPEPTYEGLCKLLAVGQPSVGIFASEGGQFIGGHGMSDDAKLRTVAGLSALWDGQPIKRVRVGDGAVVLSGRRLAAHLLMQPVVANVMLGDVLISGQGLLSRFLVGAPETAAGTRLWHEGLPESAAALARYSEKLKALLEAPLPLASGKTNELKPRDVPLVPEARRLWIAFADHVERHIAAGGDLEPIRGLANKLPEHAARLAAVLALVDDPNAAKVGGDHMAAGIELAKHYAAEALRLAGTARVSAELRLAQRALAWLLGPWKEKQKEGETGTLMSLPDLYQFGPSAIRDKATAERVVTILEDHGWLKRLPGPAEVNKVMRHDVWAAVEATE